MLPNRDGSLRPGMFAVATFRSRKLQPRVVVPRTAIMRLQDKDWVFRKEGPSKFRRVEMHTLGAGCRWNAGDSGWGESPAKQLIANALEFSSSCRGARQMIRYLIDFALRNRILVLSLAAVLFCLGHCSLSTTYRSKPIQTSPTLTHKSSLNGQAMRPRKWNNRLQSR